MYCSTNIIQMIKSRRKEWTGHVACVGERRGTYCAFVGTPEGKRPLGRRRRRREDNIKMEHQEVGWGHGLIDLDKDRDR